MLILKAALGSRYAVHVSRAAVKLASLGAQWENAEPSRRVRVALAFYLGTITALSELSIMHRFFTLSQHVRKRKTKKEQ